MSDFDDAPPPIPEDDDMPPPPPEDDEEEMPPPPPSMPSSDEDSGEDSSDLSEPSEPDSESDDEPAPRAATTMRDLEEELKKLELEEQSLGGVTAEEDLANLEKAEFETKVDEQFHQLELLKIQQTQQQHELERMRSDQIRAKEEQEARRQAQREELEAIRAQHMAVATADNLVKVDPSQPLSLAESAYTIVDGGVIAMHADVAARVIQTLTLIRSLVDDLTTSMDKVDPRRGGLKAHPEVSRLMRQLVAIHPRLITLIMSGALTEEELYEMASALNDRIMACTQRFKTIDSQETTEIQRAAQSKVSVTQMPMSPTSVQEPAPAASSPVTATPASPVATITQPRPPAKRTLTVTVERCRLPDAESLVSPLITLQVADGQGTLLMPPRDFDCTPVIEKGVIYFGSTLTIDRPVMSFPKDSCAFLELKYFKGAKNKMSTKAWAFFFFDESRTGSFEVNLHKKPMKLNRKKPQVIRDMNGKNLVLQIKLLLQ